MRRILAFGLAWLAAGVVASVVAWQGVGLIGDQVTDERPATLTAAQVDEALARSSRTSEATAPTTAPTTTATSPGAPATTAPAGEATTKVYTLAGGSAAFRFHPEGVTLAWATPAPGYTARNGPGDNGGWRVEFEGAGGKSRVDAWWDAGPQDRVRDDADGDPADDGGGDHDRGADG